MPSLAPFAGYEAILEVLRAVLLLISVAELGLALVCFAVLRYCFFFFGFAFWLFASPPPFNFARLLRFFIGSFSFKIAR